MEWQAAVIEGSATHILHSDLTRKDYLIAVGLPYGYHNDPEKKWPVVYHIDGNVYFGMITDMVRSMAWCGPTSDAIVVGIGYDTKTELDKAWEARLDNRYHDLTPVRDEEREKSRLESNGRDVRSGGAGDFLAFLTSDILPLIETNYRADQHNRTLAGHSFGGLFTLFAMFQQPGQFKNFVACSPSMFWKGQAMLKTEEAFAGKHDDLPVKLFLSMGTLENTDSSNGMQNLIEQLESRQYEQLKMKVMILEDEDHCTVIAPGFAAGLRFALSDG